MQKGKQENSTQPFKSDNDTFNELVKIIETRIEDEHFILSDWQKPVKLGLFHEKLNNTYETGIKNWIISTPIRRLESNLRSIDSTKLQNALCILMR